jgi:hypothetical protein
VDTKKKASSISVELGDADDKLYAIHRRYEDARKNQPNETILAIQTFLHLQRNNLLNQSFNC